MGHTVVGGLLLGHTVRGEGFGWGRQVNIRTASQDASAGLWGQTPPRFLDRCGEVFEDLAGDVAFQAAHDLSSVEAFGPSASDVLAGLVV